MEYFLTYLIGIVCYLVCVYEMHEEEPWGKIRSTVNENSLYNYIEEKKRKDKKKKRKIIKASFFIAFICIFSFIYYICDQYDTWNIIELTMDNITPIIKRIFTFLGGICTPYCTKLATKTLKKIRKKLKKRIKERRKNLEKKKKNDT